MPGINRYVSEVRHFKVKQRQKNKFNGLLEKEVNVTWSSTPGAQAGSVASSSSPQAGSTLPLVARDSSPQ